MKTLSHFLAIAILLTQSLASAGDMQRLWLAESKGSQRGSIYILAASHYGLPVEYDSYLEKAVIPAFLQSDILYFEGAGGREHEQEEKCNYSNLDESGMALLKKAREKAVELSMQNILNTLDLYHAMGGDGEDLEKIREGQFQYFQNVDEFNLLTSIHFDLLRIASRKSIPVEAEDLRGNIAEALLSLRPDLPVRDLDSRHGVRRAYCRAGKERIRYLESTMNSTNDKDPAIRSMIPKWNADFSALIRGEKIKEGSAMVSESPLDNSFICERNIEWANELIGKNEKQNKFVVIGARHARNLDGKFAKCDGIITILEKNGFNVTNVFNVVSSIKLSKESE